MASIDVSLQPLPGREELAVLVVSPASQAGFTAPVPVALLEAQAAWRRRFLHHHGSPEGGVPAAVLEDYTDQLIRGLRGWFEHERWQPLHRALRQQPGLPLRLRLAPGLRELEELPWETLPLDRPLWRLPPLDPPQPVAVPRARRARLLLVVGHEQDLDLESEVEALQDLARRGRQQLRILRGPAAGPQALQAALTEEPGWDALLFLGHGEAAAGQGGRLQLGDGSWVSGERIEEPLRRAVDRGLTLVLLHCCLGIDLAHRCLAAGVAWAQVFRERVPDGAAAEVFRRLLRELQAGHTFAQAQQRAALALEQPPWSGCRGLLSVYGHPDAAPYRWPRPREGLGRRELLLAGGAAGVAYGLGHALGWHGRGQAGQVTWTMQAYLGSAQYRRLLVGQVPQRLAERVRILSGGTFQIRLLEGRDLSGSEILRRVNAGRKVQCGYIDVYYDRNLWPLIFAKAVPFGLNPREQTAWLWYTREGEDRPFHQTVYPRLTLEGVRLDQLRSLPLTLTGGQMGGWFKKEVNSLEDLRGLRMRIPGLGAEVLKTFGVSSDFEINNNRIIPADQILPRLRTDLDAAEWIGPYDDEVLGLHTAARYYYSPGWWEPSTTNELMVNQQAFAALSPSHRLALETACAETFLWSRREYDLRNIQALARLRANGVQLRRFSPAMMEAFRRESERLLRMRAEDDPQRFGYVHAEWLRFRDRIHDVLAVTQYQPDSPCG
ncbi:MAG: CHAT domain-containing protein [Synechococcaceae cyanobacterium]|nr:CHAT domain-containing protein [Synechococcaceae cyanobacterium]